MPNHENRFKKEAGLFDSPIVNPDSSVVKKKSPKKWDERMSKRYIALETICPEIKYFAADFESWAREAFEVDSEEYTNSVKLARKLSKTEALLYNIISAMTDMAKTGEVNPREVKAFESAFVKLAQDLGFNVEAELEVKANCLPLCTCPPSAKCPDDHKCDNCKSCIAARDLEKTAGMNEVCGCPDGYNCPNGELCQGCDACELKRQAAHSAAEGDEEKKEFPFEKKEEKEPKDEDKKEDSEESKEEETEEKEEEEESNSKKKEFPFEKKDEESKEEEADSDIGYEMQYSLEQDETGKFNWLAAVKGTGYDSLEDAEKDIEHIFKNAIDRMDLEEEVDENLEEAEEGLEEEASEPKKVEFEDVDTSNIPAQEIAHKDGFEEEACDMHPAQEVAHTEMMDEGKPNWREMAFDNTSDEDLERLEAAFEDEGVFSLLSSKTKTMKIHGTDAQIDRIIKQVLGE